MNEPKYSKEEYQNFRQPEHKDGFKLYYCKCCGDHIYVKHEDSDTYRLMGMYFMFNCGKVRNY